MKVKATTLKLRDDLKIAQESNEELRRAFFNAESDRDKFKSDSARWKHLYENQQRHNKTVSDRLLHQERLVRALTDALADKYYPVPTNVSLSVDYRVAKGDKEPEQQ
jgi:hypothetical protein